MDQIPKLNYSSDTAVKYLRVKDLKLLNQRDEVTFNYNLLDPETKARLKLVIDKKTQYWLDKKAYLNPKVVDYLKELFKRNQGPIITIEYKKLINDFSDDTLFEIVYKNHREKTTVIQDFRGSIQRVLIERTHRLYNYMLLNPGV